MSGRADFWVRRKAAVQAEEQAAKAALEHQALQEQHLALEESSDAEILAELNLPDPDLLKMGDDFSAFMAKAVPDRIRRRALRMLWRSNPVLANVDMLVDYGEDFTDAATVVENMQTAYQVGKGMLKHLEEMARQADEREHPPEAIEEQPEAEELLADPPAEAPVPVAYAKTDMAEEEEPMIAPTPRRMKFTIEESAA
ncbi:MAG: DUF3306 domain-containing protein [Sulfitobacter sp.]